MRVGRGRREGGAGEKRAKGEGGEHPCCTCVDLKKSSGKSAIRKETEEEDEEQERHKSSLLRRRRAKKGEGTEECRAQSARLLRTLTSRCSDSTRLVKLHPAYQVHLPTALQHLPHPFSLLTSPFSQLGAVSQAFLGSRQTERSLLNEWSSAHERL